MVDTIGHVNAVSGAPSYNGRKLRQLNGVGFAGATTARPLGARSGVRPGTPATTVTATSSTWTVQPHAGLIDGQTAAEAGAYPFAFDAVATGAVAVASASFARVDIVYVQIDDPSESDGSSIPAVARKYLPGLVANTPQALPARSILLAHINVPISGGGSPTVTWKAPYCVSAGGTAYFNTKAEMEAWLTAPKGQRAHVLADSVEYLSNGAGTWPAVRTSPVEIIATGTITGQSTINIDGLTGFDEYEIVLDLPTASVANILNARLRKAGVPDASANYDLQREQNADTLVNASSALGATSWSSITPGGRTDKHLTVRLFGLNAATRRTIANVESTIWDATASPNRTGTSLRHRLAVAANFDGLEVTTNTGTVTGTYVVKGIRYS